MKTVKVYLRKIRLNAGGYDDNGNYYGRGDDLYQADLDFYDDTLKKSVCKTQMLRANCRERAKEKVNLFAWDFEYGIKIAFFR